MPFICVLFGQMKTEYILMNEKASIFYTGNSILKISINNRILSCEFFVR